MDFTYSKHADERIKDRGLTKSTVSNVIQNPDNIIQESSCKQVFPKVINEDQSKYLYRVFVNICKQPPLIITAYKTSKIDKYEY